MNNTLKSKEVWFVTGSQHLYGPKTLKQVDVDSSTIVDGFNKSGKFPLTIVFKPVVKTPDEILDICIQASSDKNCIGLITWMHTFSPAKMWIAGLKALTKPVAAKVSGKRFTPLKIPLVLPSSLKMQRPIKVF